MEENEYLIILYDYYGELLNELQRNYFELYYFDNLSLSEIATENVKNVVGEDVHTSTSSKTVVNNCTVRLSANL